MRRSRAGPSIEDTPPTYSDRRLPGEYLGRIVEKLEQVAGGFEVITVEVSGLRHLGAGVAYTITSQVLQEIRATLKAECVS